MGADPAPPIPRRPEDPRRSVRLRRQIWHTLYERRNHDSETPQEVAVVGPDTTRLRHEETGVVAAFREREPARDRTWATVCPTARPQQPAKR